MGIDELTDTFVDMYGHVVRLTQPVFYKNNQLPKGVPQRALKQSKFAHDSALFVSVALCA